MGKAHMPGGRNGRGGGGGGVMGGGDAGGCSGGMEGDGGGADGGHTEHEKHTRRASLWSVSVVVRKLHTTTGGDDARRKHG